jgi:hypothetical protein
MDTTPHVEVANRMSNLEKVTLTNVGFGVGLIISASFRK